MYNGFLRLWSTMHACLVANSAEVCEILCFLSTGMLNSLSEKSLVSFSCRGGEQEFLCLQLSHMYAGPPSDAESETFKKLHNDLARRGVTDFRMVRVEGPYYDRPLEYRASVLQAQSIHHLCKTMVMENTRVSESAEGPADPRLSKYYMVLVQYSASINAEKLKSFVHEVPLRLLGRFEIVGCDAARVMSLARAHVRMLLTLGVLDDYRSITHKLQIFSHLRGACPFVYRSIPRNTPRNTPRNPEACCSRSTCRSIPKAADNRSTYFWT
jgi:hypothetical protein